MLVPRVPAPIRWTGAVVFGRDTSGYRAFGSYVAPKLRSLVVHASPLCQYTIHAPGLFGVKVNFEPPNCIL